LRAPRQTQLLRSDFTAHGLTTGCPGCDVIRRKSTEAARHNDTCRRRMEPLLQQSETGRLRIRHAHDRAAQYLDDLVQQPTGLVHDDLGQTPAKRRGGIVPGSSSPVSFENSAADATAPAAPVRASSDSAAPVRASSDSTNPTLPPDRGSGMTDVDESRMADVDVPPHRGLVLHHPRHSTNTPSSRSGRG
jgi:hypothetical protein